MAKDSAIETAAARSWKIPSWMVTLRASASMAFFYSSSAGVLAAMASVAAIASFTDRLVSA